MKIMRTERLIDAGEFSSSQEWNTIESHIISAIQSIQWPPHLGSFTLRDKPGKKRGEGSGVKPIKEACMQHLRSLGWGRADYYLKAFCPVTGFGCGPQRQAQRDCSF